MSTTLVSSAKKHVLREGGGEGGDCENHIVDPSKRYELSLSLSLHFHQTTLSTHTRIESVVFSFHPHFRFLLQVSPTTNASSWVVEPPPRQPPPPRNPNRPPLPPPTPPMCPSQNNPPSPRYPTSTPNPPWYRLQQRRRAVAVMVVVFQWAVVVFQIYTLPAKKCRAS